MLRQVEIFLLLAVGALTATALPARAQDPYERSEYGPQVLPLDRVLPIVRNGRAGRFFDAEGPFPDADGGYHYRIKWLTPEGRVIWLDTDARTGRVLGVARGDWRENGPPPAGIMGRPPPDERFGRPRDLGMPHGRHGPGGFDGGWHDRDRGGR